MKIDIKQSALPIVLLIAALAVGPVTLPRAAHGAEASQEEPARAKKNKKKVRATLVEPAGSETVPAGEAAKEAEDVAPDREEPAAAREEATEGDDAEPRDATPGDPDTGADRATTGASATSTERPAEETGTSSERAADPTAASEREDGAPSPAAAAATGAARADEPARSDRDLPTFDERVEVIEVFLDAIVKDGKEIVAGLGPEDFLVEEEGREVEVTSVEFYGTPDQLSASGEGEIARADRYFILLFHDRARDAPFLRSTLLDAGQQARRWAEEQLLPNDQVAVLMYDVRLKVYTDFTRDQEQIVEAIGRAVSAKKEPERAAGRSKEPLRPSADSPSLLLNLPAGRDLLRETGRFEDALTLLGRAAEGIVGRKNLMLFSVGFGDTDPGGVWTPDPRYYPDLERSLNDGNVAVYAIDLVGARRVGTAGPGIASSLSSLGADTAGLYLESFTTFLTPMRQVTDDTRGYYLLSYRSEYDRGTSGYREVKVATRDKRYAVRARKGYLYGEETLPLAGPDDEGDEEEGDAFPEGRDDAGTPPDG